MRSVKINRRFVVVPVVVTLAASFALYAARLYRSGATPPAPAPARQPADGKSPADYVDSLIRTMSVEEKVGQLFMVGFPGKVMGYEARTLVEDYHVGGVILFARNVDSPAQVAYLTNQLQQAATASGARIPLLIAADQEGGTVNRLGPKATIFPGQMALGATGSVEFARRQGEITGQELRTVGINVNFAPVVDVNNNPRNPVIGIRSLGEDPQAVSRLAVAYIEGLQKAGVMATAKHFPGHGDTTVDSHVGLPVINHPRERLETVELAPFRAAIAAGVQAIMTAHIVFPSIDSTPGLPATLSEKVLTGLLRNEMGFSGLIFTDALEMGAIDKTYGIEEAAVMALRAGADVMLIAWPKDWYDAVRAIKRVVEAVKQGEVKQERVDAAVRRVLLAKYNLGLFQKNQVDQGKVNELVGRAENREVGLEIARRSITVVRNSAGLLPLKSGYTGRVLVIGPQETTLTGVEELGAASSTLGKAVRSGAKNVTEYLYPVRSFDPAAAVAQARQADLIIVGTYRASQYRSQVDMVNQLLQLGKPVIVIALREPYDIMEFPQVKTYIATYGTSTVSMTALGDILFGRIKPAGKLPVSIPNVAQAGTGLSW
ncbi:MAG: beta-N-acetylhexosaminidase [Limnochordales bacterium]|nr:beta-N-acetylhexosaminidase [Limnochordales bacterium]